MDEIGEAAMLRGFGSAFGLLRVKHLDARQQRACNNEHSENSSGRAHGTMISKRSPDVFRS